MKDRFKLLEPTYQCLGLMKLEGGFKLLEPTYQCLGLMKIEGGFKLLEPTKSITNSRIQSFLVMEIGTQKSGGANFCSL
jgi:hypothetical protein